MKVIVGLGNPGREYAGTRHNVGWWVVDHLADVWRFDGWKKDGAAHLASGTVHGTRVRLVKPQTARSAHLRAPELPDSYGLGIAARTPSAKPAISLAHNFSEGTTMHSQPA